MNGEASRVSGIALVINVYAHAVCNLSVPLATEFKTSAQSSSKPFTVGDTSTSEAQSLALKGAPPSAAQMVHLCTLHSEGRGRADRLLIVKSLVWDFGQSYARGSEVSSL